MFSAIKNLNFKQNHQINFKAFFSVENNKKLSNFDHESVLKKTKIQNLIFFSLLI